MTDRKTARSDNTMHVMKQGSASFGEAARWHAGIILPVSGKVNLLSLVSQFVWRQFAGVTPLRKAHILLAVQAQTGSNLSATRLVVRLAKQEADQLTAQSNPEVLQL